ncbi:lipoprotein YedD [Erwinia psidii]|uniref:Lipoprotein n=1 Tax=Erwinia psidii TaxID=69224 RepID=A0A3N6SKH0_9GAMM|nr:lipoprotein YedD [Erwinia psidii]MCX8956303.1 lipoprotein [Erwinia psidii]MCX8959937.1 lipoprotein [Erwinia psidii]MCX8963483.1 lipoprotein [Erwinia psidii]RQM39301.1 lipoprotein [Erwinia psidii]
MKKWMLAAAVAVALSGCARIPNYQSAVKTPPPASLEGNWQTVGPQKGLVSKEAVASLIINASGDTLDCRQWQRVIAKPGKITQFSGDWVNVNNESRVMTLESEGATLYYDKLVMQKVNQPTAECQDALKHLGDRPVASPANAASTGGKSHHKSTLKNSKF